VRAIDAKVAAAEENIAAGAVMSTEELLQRLTAQGRADLSDFVSFTTPEQARQAVEACGTDKERAARILAAIEHRGWYLDVGKAILAGKGPALEQLVVGTDATGFPEVKIKVRDPHPALRTLARIKGLLQDKEPPPPRPPLMIMNVLAQLPFEQLAALNAAFETAAMSARAIPAEATPAAGSLDGKLGGRLTR
jgi:hypothetical protein